MDKATDSTNKFITSLKGGKWSRKYLRINLTTNEFYYKMNPSSSKRVDLSIGVNISPIKNKLLIY